METSRNRFFPLYRITLITVLLLPLLLCGASGASAQVREGSLGHSSQRSTLNFSAAAQSNGEIDAFAFEGERAPIHRPMPRSVRPLPGSTNLTSVRDLFLANPLSAGVPPEASLALSPSPAALFSGLADNDTSIPPDTNGAVGPSHLMLTLNSQVRVQDRAGNTLSTLGLQSFWSSLNNPRAFDPRVLYEPFSDRWIVSAGADSGKPTSSILVGVSQSGDPTKNWNLYRVNVDPTGKMWGDYPTLGFNKDWVIVDVNLFAISDNSYKQTNVYVFNKADLYSHGTGRYTQLTNDSEASPAVIYDNSLASSFLLADYNGNSGGSGYLGLYTITGAVGAEHLSSVTLISSPNPWGQDPPGGLDFLSQLGSVKKVQTDDSRIQSLVYRNGALWSVQTVLLPAEAPTHGAVQWWELTPTGGVMQRGRIEDPSGQISYTCPSLAVNKSNDLLIGYSKFAATQFVSADYSYRAGTDPAGTMRGDIAYKNGEASYFKLLGGNENRWGDYSASVIDPVNDQDMWTLQEYAAAPLSGSDRWGVWWARVGQTIISPGTNPIDDAQTFVTQHYLDFLSRQPDASGLAYWSSKIANCGSDTVCINSERIAVSAAFFIELEFQQTGSYVYRMYKGTLGRQPFYSEFTSDRAQVVGGAGLEASKTAFAEAWVQRPEFVGRYPLSLTSSEFVDSLLQTVKSGDGVDLSLQRGALINELNTGSTRGKVARDVIEAKEFINAEYNPSFVLMQYFGYLKRDPDPGGYSFWLNILNNKEPNNFHGMVCSFLTSAEYQQRFSPIVTRTNADCRN